jgi:hypothetical protein
MPGTVSPHDEAILAPRPTSAYVRSKILPGLLAFYKMQTDGSDSHSNGLHLSTVHNGPISHSAAKKGNGADFELDSLQGYRQPELGTYTELVYTNKLLVSYFVKHEEISGQVHICKRSTVGPGGQNVFICECDDSNGNINFSVYDTAETEFKNETLFGDTDGPLKVDTLHHVCCYYNGSEAVPANRCKVWIDGDQMALTASGTNPASLNDATAVTGGLEVSGWNRNSGLNMDGILDEVGVWGDLVKFSPTMLTFLASGKTPY